METKHEDRLHARNLYFGTTMSQQEIADQCNINRKTLYLWMNEGGWRRAKYAAAHAPGLLLDQYYEQLGKLNQHIATRENPWPTKDEAGIIRRIMLSVKQLTNSDASIAQTVGVFHNFIEYLRFKENKFEMAKEYMQPMDRYVKKIIEDKQWLSYNTITGEEKQFEAEYAQWLKTQKQDEQPDVILSSSKGQPTAAGEEKEQPGDVILSAPKDELQSKPTEQPQPDPNSNNVILSLPKTPIPNLPALPTGQVGDRQGSDKKPAPAQPQPQTFWEMRQQQESARLGTTPPVKAQPYNPNSNNVILSSSKNQTPNSNQQNSNANSAPQNHNTSSPRGRSGGASYSPGTQPNGTPVPHPTQPRHLTNIDIQKMMETPQSGQQENNFNPKRY